MGQAAPGRQQGLLQRVLGVLGGPEDPVAVQPQFALVGADELAERMLVAGLYPPGQVCRHRAILPSPSPCGSCRDHKCGPAGWAGTSIRWDLRQDGDWTIVLFKQEGYPEPTELMHHSSTKWATFLPSLKQLVETGTGTPHPRSVTIGDWQ
jgi:hypothetical protein